MGGLVVLVCSSQLGHQVGAVVAGVVGDDGGQLGREGGGMVRHVATTRTFRKRSSEARRTIIRALAKDSMATASFPGVLLARSDTTLAISISEQPEGVRGEAEPTHRVKMVTWKLGMCVCFLTF